MRKFHSNFTWVKFRTIFPETQTKLEEKIYTSLSKDIFTIDNLRHCLRMYENMFCQEIDFSVQKEKS